MRLCCLNLSHEKVKVEKPKKKSRIKKINKNGEMAERPKALACPDSHFNIY